MYGSITRITARQGQADAAVAAWREAWAGRATAPGMRHTYLLVDRARDEFVVVGLWDDAAAATAYNTSADVERGRSALRPLLAADALADRRIYEVAETL